MYKNHFGLTERPFSIAPDPRYLYLGADHQEALAHLLYGICERGGFVQLTGEVGTGKTLITRKLIEELPDDVDLALILNPALTVREFLIAICDELQVPIPRRSHSTHALMEQLTHYLLDAYARGRHTVVLIDEAHCLSTLVLEQVRLLTNLETTREKLLQIILVGQPELRETLARNDMRQLAQRITARYHLRPLTLAGTRRYISHRMQIAGAREPLFSLPAQALLHRLSGGIPRLLNVLCDRALLGAYASRRSRVDFITALRAAREVAGKPPPRWRLAGAAALALIIIAGGISWQLGAFTRAPTELAQTQKTQSLSAQISLDDWLSAAHDTDLKSATEALFTLWRVDAPVTNAPCEQALDLNLRCYYQTGGWQALTGTNLPAILELSDRYGRTHRVVAQSIEDGRMTLSTGGREASYPRSEVEQRWSGSSLLLWRLPNIGRDTITPGSEGKAVDWLVQRLARIDGAAAGVRGRSYDEQLRARVRAFQRAHGLQADGIVGEETLLRLMTALPDPNAPHLRRES